MFTFIRDLPASIDALRAKAWLAFGVLALLAASPAGAQTAASFDPGANDVVLRVLTQPDGGILVGGFFTQVAGATRRGIARLHHDGRLDTTFDPDVVPSDVRTIARQADGRILIGGTFMQVGGVTRPRLARLHADGTLDTGFNPSPDISVERIVVQADGRILVGGFFTQIGGAARNRIARLQPDGSLDASFNAAVNGTASGSSIGAVRGIAIQPDGRILIAGDFTQVGGQPRNQVARLMPDGSLDESFNSPIPASAANVVNVVALQADGRILLGGNFGISSTQRNLIRLLDDGSIDSGFHSFPDGTVRDVIVRPDGKILICGTFTLVNQVAKSHIALVSDVDGAVVTPFFTSTTNPVASTINSMALQEDGRIVVGGVFNSFTSNDQPDVPRNNLARLNADGSLDNTLIADTNTLLGIAAPVLALAEQTDGKVLVGGRFTTLKGVARNRLARLLPSGVLDSGFNPDVNGDVNAIAVLADGDILVGGAFTQVGPTARNNFARIMPDGVVRSSFTASVDGTVNAVAVPSTGPGFVMIGGAFNTVNSLSRNNVVRVSANSGGVDSSFSANTDGEVRGIALYADGRSLIGGDFTQVRGVTRNRIARLSLSGDVDTGFSPDVNGTVNAVAIQHDGRIVIGGAFTNINGQERNRIARLNADGTLDTGFTLSSNGVVNSLVLQADGKILIGGAFTQIGGQNRRRIARLHADGSFDADFIAGVDPTGSFVSALLMQSDGKLLIGGTFSTVSATNVFLRAGLARLSLQQAASQRLEAAANRIRWFRDGLGPELETVRFEESDDGVNWFNLGNATAIDGGWAMNNVDLSLTAPFYIRARGLAPGGSNNGSRSLIESVRLVDQRRDILFFDGFE